VTSLAGRPDVICLHDNSTHRANSQLRESLKPQLFLVEKAATLENYLVAVTMTRSWFA
jgi:predicted phosphohydrolase